MHKQANIYKSIKYKTQIQQRRETITNTGNYACMSLTNLIKSDQNKMDKKIIGINKVMPDSVFH